MAIPQGCHLDTFAELACWTGNRSVKLLQDRGRNAGIDARLLARVGCGALGQAGPRSARCASAAPYTLPAENSCQKPAVS